MIDYEIEANDIKCKTSKSGSVTRYDFSWDDNREKFAVIKFSVPCIGVETIWEPTTLLNRPFNLSFATSAMGAVPLICFLNASGRSIYSFALSDTVHQIDYVIAINERTAEMDCTVKIGFEQFGDAKSCFLEILTFDCEKPLYEVCGDTERWWSKFYDFNVTVSDEVYNPAYSTWYSYHHDFSEKELLDECRRAKKLGMDMLLVDSGWHSSNRACGSKYSGDYEFSAEKIPDMRTFADRVHKIGMKIILWYSVSFVGFESKLWERFGDKIIGKYEDLNVGILDPRYPEVREYMKNKYVYALQNWNIDGFKLDFIDSFRVHDDTGLKHGMDICSIKEAVEKLMSDAVSAMRKIKPDVITELRQGYVGPNMRQYASIFRAVDCPENYRQNRVGTVDLRMLSGKTAVHSDMIMWNNGEKAHIAARQILNSIFSVLQISVKIEELPEGHLKMLEFWLDFARKNRDILIFGKIMPEEENNFYPIVRAESGDAEIIAVYEINKVVHTGSRKITTVINASDLEEMLFIFDDKSTCKYEIFDCFGEKKENGSAEDDILRINVPKSGFIIFKR